MLTKLNIIFVTLFGVGKLKKIPGTYASFFTIVILFIVFHLFKLNPYFFLIILFAIFFISIIAINNFTKENDNKDPKEVVIDEFIGQSIPVVLYEISHNASNNTTNIMAIYLAMFFLFRIFDIFKPFPVSFFDRKIKNGFGVIMDDVCAGMYVFLIFIIYMSFVK